MRTTGRLDNARVREISGGVTAAHGYCASAAAAGIKTSKGPDCGLLISEVPCSAAGAFTTNAVRASSVDWCEKLLPSARVRAVFANSGNANACTGGKGERDTKRIAELIGQRAGAKPQSVLVASTGVIGHALPMGLIEKNIPLLYRRLDSSAQGGRAFADAILTTDTKRKEAAVSVETPAGRYIIGGCAKGSGMIHPNMATMLCFITTDAVVNRTLLDTIVKNVVDMTFNNLTVDGDTSTNDMVLVLANGMSGAAVKSAWEASVFQESLRLVSDALCRKIAADGEGATKRVEICVSGAATQADAKKAAKAVAGSNLVKTALFGNDPNWGRIVCAVGYSGASFSNKRLAVKLCGTRVFSNGGPAVFDARALSRKMRSKVVPIEINLGAGREYSVVYTCDLTYDYIRINAEYHT